MKTDIDRESARDTHTQESRKNQPSTGILF